MKLEKEYAIFQKVPVEGKNYGRWRKVKELDEKELKVYGIKKG